MKICFLAPSNSEHTKKWCSYFVSRGHEVYLVSFCDKRVEGVQQYYVYTGSKENGNDIQKLKYLTQARYVRRIVKHIDPDVINVHYATSYGAVAALAGLKDYVLSVWGTDVYEFPRKSILHRALLEFSLFRAKHIFSTSRAMAQELQKYTRKGIHVTPFGVDVQMFSPEKRTRGDDAFFIVGTVKSLDPKYGIDYLIKGVAQARRKEPEIPLRLRIAGSGPYANAYHKLSCEQGIEDVTDWLGFISQEQAAVEWANMDVAIVPSVQESFGVSAVEAEASGCAMIVSDVPGLMEATKPGVTSVVVPSKNEDALADAIIFLYRDTERRKQMKEAGRRYVLENYSLEECFGRIESLFYKFLNE